MAGSPETSSPRAASFDDVAPARQAEPPNAREVVCVPRSLPANPYLDLLYDHLAPHGLRRSGDGRLSVLRLLRARRRACVIHVHWPEGLYRLSRPRGGATLPLACAKLLLFCLRLLTARALRFRVIWTVHQPLPHERGWQDLPAALVLARAANRLLAHDRATAERTAATLHVDPRRFVVIPHGSYAGAYRTRRGRRATREMLGIPEESYAFLCFGEIRAYKGLELLSAAWAGLDRADCRLVVAGYPKEASAAARLRAAAAQDERIRLRLERVPDDDVADLYAACEAAVLPRSDGGTSGALVLALSLGAPVVAADLPVVRETLGGAAAGWLFEPGSAASLTAALARAIDDPRGAARAAAAHECASRFAWPALAARTAAELRGDET